MEAPWYPHMGLIRDAIKPLKTCSVELPQLNTLERATSGLLGEGYRMR